MRKTLEQVERTAGKHDKQLDTKELPEGFEYIAEMFFGMWNGDVITWSTLDAYEHVTKSELTGVEITALMALSRTASAAIAEITKDSIE